MIRFLKSVVLATVTILPVSFASAAPITTPGGLVNGDQYRLVFVTSQSRNAFSNSIANYNSWVSGIANGVTELAALGTTWMAIGSTAAVDARDNIGANPNVSTGVPIYLLDGSTKVADNNADLWDGTLDAGINVFENGNIAAMGLPVWTGTDDSGVAQNGGIGALGMVRPRTGAAGFDTFRWTNNGHADDERIAPLYAISGIITVGGTSTQIPAPGATLLFAMTLVGGLLIRRRYR